jgi:hypothetical protein
MAQPLPLVRPLQIWPFAVRPIAAVRGYAWLLLLLLLLLLSPRLRCVARRRGPCFTGPSLCSSRCLGLLLLLLLSALLAALLTAFLLL